MELEPIAVSEELWWQFIAVEIQLRLTFTRMAAREYAAGKRDRGREVRTKAREAYAEAACRLQEGEARGWKTAALRDRLRDFREALDAIASEA
jgi:hypothetical protein